MKAYKLYCKEYEGELVFGIPEFYRQSLSETYVNDLFKNMKPWKHCIPYYRNANFAFVSLDALLSFLFLGSIELTSDIYEDLCDKFYVMSFDLTTWSPGLSKYLCTYFDDEVDNDCVQQYYDIKELNKFDRKYVVQDPVPPSDIDLCKEQYYKNVKTFY